MNQIITIDGPAGAGKSTVSRLLAKKMGLLYLDTGAMYRAVALQVHRAGIDFNNGKSLWRLCKDLDLNIILDGDSPKIYINDEDVSLAIRRPEMDMLSSRISAVREVREAMTEIQRKLGMAGGLVAEGRDMGTLVFPNADFKIFITATPEVRAERRYAERKNRGESVSRNEVEIELKKRDEQDKTRAIAPLCPAADAVIIDTTSLDIEQVVDKILKNIEGGDT